MALSVAYLCVSALGALWTLIGLWPPRGPRIGTIGFVLAWFEDEAPLHQIAWQVGGSVGFALGGALEHAPGEAGLALGVASWIALFALFASGVRSKEAFEHAGIVPARRRVGLLRYVMLVPFKRRTTSRTRGIDYSGAKLPLRRLDVYYPKKKVTKAPVMLYIHGGAWVFGSKREQGLVLVDELVSSGWVVVSIDYPLSPRARWPAHLEACQEALGWVVGNIYQWGGDPEKIAVSGGSAGGHLASLLALGAKEVKACVGLYGVYEILPGTGPSGYRAGAYEENLADLFERFVIQASRQSSPELFERASPIRVLTKARMQADPGTSSDPVPAFLLVHGQHDTLVPIAQARAFHDALTSCGAASTLVELPWAEHAFDVFFSPRAATTAKAIRAWLESVPGLVSEGSGR